MHPKTARGVQSWSAGQVTRWAQDSIAESRQTCETNLADTNTMVIVLIAIIINLFFGLFLLLSFIFSSCRRKLVGLHDELN